MVAGSAMLAYAFFSGILRVSFSFRDDRNRKGNAHLAMSFGFQQIQTQRRVDYPDIDEMEVEYGEEEKDEQGENQE